LWLFNSAVSDEKGDRSYLIIDSEGLDSNNEDGWKLICLIWWISSVVVYKEHRTLDIQKFGVFRSVWQNREKMHNPDPPALAVVLGDDLKLPADTDSYLDSFLHSHSAIGEAVIKCFPFHTITQLANPKEYEMKDPFSGQFFSSFVEAREKLEGLLLEKKLGSREATGEQMASFVIECVGKLNEK